MSKNEFKLELTKKYEFECYFSDFEKADAVIVGIPYDGTCSNRPGARFGPIAVRRENDGLETYSPYQKDDLTNYRICDIGDMVFPFGNSSKVVDIIYDNAKDIMGKNKKILSIGGEHLVTYPLVKAYSEKYRDINIVHFDAHLDLRDEYLGEKLSHATVLRRCHEVIGGKIYQYGIRSGTAEEFAFAKENTFLTPFHLEGIEKLRDALEDKPVYISIDLDVLDPSVFPGTGTIEPGGITFRELMNGILKLKGLNIVGADIVELSPDYDNSGLSSTVASKVLREVALLMVG